MKKQLKGDETEINNFSQEVINGLSSPRKKINSKYLYNDEGSRLFEEIMNLPEYYPSRCELEILQKNKKEILDYIQSGSEIYVVDLGAGNGLKTMVLLSYFIGKANFKYIPIDISMSALMELETSLTSRFGDFVTESFHGDYMKGLANLKQHKDARKLILFLGSNIGNFNFKEALKFLKEIREVLNQDDLILIGFDLQKDPHVIRAAYNDVKGITQKFNLNLLQRMNEDLGATFNLGEFMFYPSYDPATGELKSYLMSKKDQEVVFKKLNISIQFSKWETIHTECSNKFSLATIIEMAKLTGFFIEENFFDSKNYFVDSLWKAK